MAPPRLVPPALLLALSLTASPAPAARLYLGTFDGGEPPSRGIYVADFDPATGRLDPPQLAAPLASATWIEFSPDRRTLYAAARGTQTVHAFAIDAATGALTEHNHLPTGGESPADLALDPATGRTLVLINFVGASVVAYAVAPDGALLRETSRHLHAHHTGAVPDRQKQAHPHAAVFSPDGRFLAVPDLGGDRLHLYTHDAATSTLAPHPTQPFVELPPGSGPRNAHFSADARHLYLVNELASTVATFSFEASAAAPLRQTQLLPLLPADFGGTSLAAVCALSPDGKFLYASNRGHDSLAVFARDAATGELTFVERVSSGGKHPRHFTLTDDGRWLLAANRESNDLIVFARDAATGRLTRTDAPRVPLGQPVCLRLLP